MCELDSLTSFGLVRDAELEDKLGFEYLFALQLVSALAYAACAWYGKKSMKNLCQKSMFMALVKHADDLDSYGQHSSFDP